MHMSYKTPATTADVLNSSSKFQEFKTFTIVRLAEVLGVWRRPYQRAAAAVEEMTMKDFYYWVYKSRNPVCFGVKDDNIPAQLYRDPSVVELPKDFQVNSKVTFGACGDILRSKGIENSEEYLYSEIADILFDQDISYANYESPITEHELEDEIISDVAPPVECSSKQQFNILKGYGDNSFSVLNIANNHINDKGPDSIDFTVQALKEEGILALGVNASQNDYGKAKIIERKGIRIGFVSATFGLNGRELDEDNKYKVNVSKLSSKYCDPETSLLEKQIDHCKSEGCDFIIASLHWGHEFEFFPRASQVEAARSIVEYGADAIISHHPHVIQPVEYYRTKRDPNRIAVIAYSLGSLIWGYSAPHLALSIILNMSFVKGRLGQEQVTYIGAIEVTPVFRNIFKLNGSESMQIEKLSNFRDRNLDLPISYEEKLNFYTEIVLQSYNH